MSYSIAIQATRNKKFRVCFVSQHNGKLVLQGEPINRRIDAFAIAGAISMQMGVSMPTGVLPTSHKWPGNKGPKKKAVAKKVAKKK